MIHHIYANRSNIGDWLSAQAIQHLLGAPRVVEHLCDGPFVEETLYRLDKAEAGDFVVIGGGGLFMDYFEPFWSGFRKVADRIPFGIWGVGYCDLKREPSLASRRLLIEIVIRSRFAIVRDELTYRHLALGTLPDPVPCPSVCAVQTLNHAGHGLLHVDNYTTAGAGVHELMELSGKRFAEATNRDYVTTNNRIKPGSEESLRKLLERYARCDLVLTSALHGCVIALAMGRRVLAVSGDHKIESFMQAAGFGKWVLDLDEIHRLPELLNSLSQQPTSTEFIRQARDANRRLADRLSPVILPSESPN